MKLGEIDSEKQNSKKDFKIGGLKITHTQVWNTNFKKTMTSVLTAFKDIDNFNVFHLKMFLSIFIYTYRLD